MDRIVAEYDYYTLEQARKIIAEEKRHQRLVQKFRERQKKEMKKRRRKEKVKAIVDDLIIIVSISALFLGFFFCWLFIGY